MFAADTAAYLRRAPLGRHKLAPSLSPGKTWEGFLAGTLAAVAVAFFALYDAGLPLDLAVARCSALVIASPAPLGDLFESTLKRDMQVKDTGRLLGGHGGMLDRIDALLFASVAAFYVVHGPGVGHTVRVKRIALLGATGSIGRQAIEVIERNPELELVRSRVRHPTCRSTDAIRRPHTQVGGDLTELLEPRSRTSSSTRSSASPASARRSGRSSAASTLALANKESLVAAGELALAAKERGGGLLLPVDSEHSALFQCLEGASAGLGRLARPDRLGRPVPRPQRATS